MRSSGLGIGAIWPSTALSCKACVLCAVINVCFINPHNLKLFLSGQRRQNVAQVKDFIGDVECQNRIRPAQCFK
jgi:hypothetical protein